MSSLSRFNRYISRLSFPLTDMFEATPESWEQRRKRTGRVSADNALITFHSYIRIPGERGERSTDQQLLLSLHTSTRTADQLVHKLQLDVQDIPVIVSPVVVYGQRVAQGLNGLYVCVCVCARVCLCVCVLSSVPDDLAEVLSLSCQSQTVSVTLQRQDLKLSVNVNYAVFSR